MAGTATGGIKAAATNKQRYGMTFYKNIGKEGGLKSRGGGFAKNPDLARLAGRKGGMTSRKPAVASPGTVERQLMRRLDRANRHLEYDLAEVQSAKRELERYRDQLGE